MKILISTGLLIVALSAVATATGATNFSGTWVMDKSRCEGVPPDMEQTMTITQTDDTLNIETKIVIAGEEHISTTRYVLNGKEMEFKPTRIGKRG